MQAVTAFAHALSDSTRWRILVLVRDGALCVCELADILGMPQSSVSSHLQVIRKAELLASERCEKWVYYRLERKYRELILQLGKFFGVSTATDATLAADAEKAVKRLKERDESCCPGPRLLAAKGSAGSVSKVKTKPDPVREIPS
ncbi:MAG: metalloregulator ArsR/SmtB family transcription factor [Verrucomicrobiota bacterium]